MPVDCIWFVRSFDCDAASIIRPSYGSKNEGHCRPGRHLSGRRSSVRRHVGRRQGLSRSHHADTQFAKKLATRFQVASVPGPDTLRIRLTLTGAAATTPVIGTFTHLDMAGNLYNGVQAVRGREGMIAGSVIDAVEISDAPTNLLLSVYITKQNPGAMNIGASIGSLAAAETGIDKGADALIEELR